jgi:hypothetical protein
MPDPRYINVMVALPLLSACRIGFYVPATWLGLGNQPIQRQLVSGGGLFVHND